MLKQRVLTAAILIPIMVAALYFAPRGLFAVLMAAVVLLGVWEWCQFVGITTLYQRFVFLVSHSFLLVVSTLISPVYLMLIVVCWWLFPLYWIIQYPQATANWSQRTSLILFSYFVLIPFWRALVLLPQQAHPNYLMYCLILIWVADTGAFFAGRRWGKHKLAIHVSPGKTIEGVSGAFISGLLVSLISIFVLDISWGKSFLWLLLAIVTIAYSILGDLTISLFKRKIGIKDTGTILPGHGGVLDRIDSLTAALPVFTLGLYLIGILN